MVLVQAAHEDFWVETRAALPPVTPGESQGLRELRQFWGVPVDPSQDYWNIERIDVDASAAQVRATDWLGDLPLVVLSLGRYDILGGVPEAVAGPLGDVYQAQQQELAQLSSNSTHIIAEKSDWDMVSEQPDVVVDAIRQVVDAARTGTRVDAAHER